MKRIIYIVLIVLAIALIISIFIKPIIISLAERQLRKLFPDSAVSIVSCDFRPLHLLTLSNIKIKKNEEYYFKVKEVSIQYNLFSILKSAILSFSLKDAKIAISLEIDSLYSHDLHLEDVCLNLNQMRDTGHVYIDKIQYAKVQIKEFTSKARLRDKVLSLDSISAKTLGGQLKGDLSFRIDEERKYIVNLEFINLELEKFVNDFNLNKKLKLTGRLAGTVALEGRGLDINALTGDFFAAEQGGVLVIKDNRFLENIARNTKQSLDILVESFKDYHYNTGIMNVSLDKGNLVLDISLDGEAGRRNLNVVMHDFKLGRKGL